MWILGHERCSTKLKVEPRLLALQLGHVLGLAVVPPALDGRVLLVDPALAPLAILDAEGRRRPDALVEQRAVD